MQTTYTATIIHHSLARARVITVYGTLAQAKRAATREFRGDQNEYRIVICNKDGEVVASRRIVDSRWN